MEAIGAPGRSFAPDTRESSQIAPSAHRFYAGAEVAQVPDGVERPGQSREEHEVEDLQDHHHTESQSDQCGQDAPRSGRKDDGQGDQHEAFEWDSQERGEREILRLRYGLADGYAYTLEEVGKIFSVTRERVRQIETKAVRKLQQPYRARSLASFIEGVEIPTDTEAADAS